ncbi:MAG: pyridoxamine 5'-phosphate oxidase family protein [Fibrobacter sp.]|nr:pyridoxamine 5'-phosphate oxidase family protein [Fibrobacter sp.]
MERKMYFANRKMTDEKAEKFLLENRIASLAVNGDEGKPYVVPVHYIYLNNAIYFHSAKYGYKMDALKKDNRVCMSIVGETAVINEKYTASFESVIVEGKAVFVEDNTEREQVLKEMIRRWTGGFDEVGQQMIDKTIGRTAVVKIVIDTISGKAYKG